MTAHSPNVRARLSASADVLAISAGLALLAAASQLAYQLFNVLTGRRFVFASREAVWMAPVSWLVFFWVLAIFPAAIAFLSPRLAPRSVIAGAFAFVAVFCLLMPFQQVAVWATTLLALGIGARVGAQASRSGAEWTRKLSRTAGLLTVLFVVCAVAVRAWKAAAWRKSLSPVAASAGELPNVLIIVLDAVRAANTSVFGYHRPTTPALERLAAQGLAFDRAYATAPWTLPSHASMLTGLYPTQLSADYLHKLDSTAPTLAEALRARGYATAGFTANLFYTTWETGLSRGFVLWDGFQVTPEQVLFSGWPWQMVKVHELRNARSLGSIKQAVLHSPFRVPDALRFASRHSNDVVEDFLRWQGQLEARQPFFALVNLFDAHRPRFSPAEFRTRFTPNPKGPDTYDNAIAYMDAYVDSLLTTLQSRGVLDRTIVAVVADHGELLGEHGLWGHSTNVYHQTLWVPFIVRYPPRIPAGVRVQRPVSLRDLAATLQDLAGIPAAARLPGVSLLGYSGADTAHPSPPFAYAHQGINLGPESPTSAGPLRSLVEGGRHYIAHSDGGEELFDLGSDPGEMVNLAADPSRNSELQRIRLVVDSISPLGGAPRYAWTRRRRGTAQPDTGQ
jgi:arylsulfatase A-like enzyme